MKKIKIFSFVNRTSKKNNYETIDTNGTDNSNPRLMAQSETYTILNKVGTY